MRRPNRLPGRLLLCALLPTLAACPGAEKDTEADTSDSGGDGCTSDTADTTDTGESGTPTLWYADADADTWGDDTVTTASVTAPSGYVDRGGDCDDQDASLGPPVFGADCAHPYGDCDPASGPLRLVPNDYPTVGSAITAAAEGDSVCVGPGTWIESLDYGGKGIAVIGALGREVTILDGDSVGPVVVFQTAEPVSAVLQGFTITHGYAVDDGAEANDGGGIRVYGANDLTPTLRQLDIVDNASADDGGGVYIKYAAPHLDDITVARNIAGDSGGGLRIVDSDPVLTRLLIEDNEAPGAGGGIAMRGGRPVFTEVVFSHNHAGLNGGGLIALASAPTLTDVDFYDNVTDEDGGAARIIETGAFTWTGGELRGNRAAGVGGGLHFVTGGSPTLTNLLIAGNQADGATGGIQLENACSARLTNLTVTGNVGASGGAITYTGSCATADAEPNLVRNTIVSGNTSIDGGGVTMDAGVDLEVHYTDVVDNAVDYVGLPSPVGQDGNGAVPPGFVSFAPALPPSVWDLHLAALSPLRHAGDPTVQNPDGSTSDAGAYGGPDAAYDYYADDDADGMYDGWERLHGLDPTADDSGEDPDADALVNATELLRGTDPLAADTDGDGRTDADELTAGGDPLDPAR